MKIMNKYMKREEEARFTKDQFINLRWSRSSENLTCSKKNDMKRKDEEDE